MIKAELPSISVNDIEIIDSHGPWNTKSDASLMVHYALPRVALESFLDFDNPAFEAIEEEAAADIRGLRSYTVGDISKDSVGGLEWHMARTEYVNALAGAALWLCVDPAGREREFVLDGSQGIVQPPGILHTYKALEDNTCIEVVCNTLFVPEDPRTHDTFSRDIFYELRAQAMIKEGN
jgi:hypothetical protein